MSCDRDFIKTRSARHMRTIHIKRDLNDEEDKKASNQDREYTGSLVPNMKFSDEKSKS
jgi:hypothetical protein